MKAVSIGLNLTANTSTTVFTVPTGYYAKCILLHVVNATASNKHISFSWYDSSTSTSIPIVSEYTITSKSTLNEIDLNKYFVMEEGDYLTSISETGSTMSVVGTFELYRKGE
jgi:hypothetical protein